MAWTKIVFKLACPESEYGAPSPESLALVAEFNERMLPFQSDQQAIRSAFSEIDQELIDKHGLKINVQVDVDKHSWRTFFKVSCPDYLDGELNNEGVALANDLNEKLERSKDEHWKVAKELDSIDVDLVSQYQLSVIAVIECCTW